MIIQTDNSEIEVEFKYDVYLDRIDDVAKLFINLRNVIHVLMNEFSRNKANTVSNSTSSNNDGKRINKENAITEKNINDIQSKSTPKCTNRLLIDYKKDEGEIFTIIARGRIIPNIDKYNQLEKYLRELGFEPRDIRQINIRINEKLGELKAKARKDATTVEICLDNIHNTPNNLIHNCLSSKVLNELAKGKLKKCIENIAGKKILFLSRLFNIDERTVDKDLKAIVYVGKRSNGLLEVTIRKLEDLHGTEYVFQQDRGTTTDLFIKNITRYLNKLLTSNQDFTKDIKSTMAKSGQKEDIDHRKPKTIKTMTTQQGISFQLECPRCGGKMLPDPLAGQPRTFEGYIKPRYICKNCGYVTQD